VSELQLLIYPDPGLKQPSVPVQQFDRDLDEFVHDLTAVLERFPGCVGIAAPQVGRHQHIVVIDVPAKPGSSCHGRQVLINPEVIEWNGMVLGREGCLSVPDFTGDVIRAESVLVEASNADGESRTYEFTGFEARAVQHEIDHLDGLLFVDRLVSRRHDLYRRKVYR